MSIPQCSDGKGKGQTTAFSVVKAVNCRIYIFTSTKVMQGYVCLSVSKITQKVMNGFE